MASPNSDKDFYTEALIIGGGMGGVYSLHRLRQEGYQAKLVEAGSYFGGVWYWNRYPGARVDSECPLYQLNIPEVWKGWNWSERFPGHEELRRYYKYCDEVLQLSKDCIFNTIVDGVEWKDGIWTCRTRDGRTITCKYLLLCTGSSYKKHFPDFQGLDKFKGTLVHSAAYPDEGLDVKGKRVGLVGNGASGVQVLQELGKEDCELTAFVRTPNIALPMVQRKMTSLEQDQMKQYYKFLFEGSRHCRSGFPVNTWEDAWTDLTHEQRIARIEDSWHRGGFAVLLSTFREYLVDKEVNAAFYDFWKEKVRARITDKEKADIVAPVQQEHWFGTKRPSLEQDYYETLDRPNVKLVNLKKTPIKEFTEEGIVTDKLHKLDIIILATGYDSMTGSLMDLNIKDKEGKLLQEKWNANVETYLGLMIHGMPNMFMVYSPQAPTALSNGPPIIESQIEWIILAIKKMKEEGIEAIDPQDAPAKKWRQDIQDMNQVTLYPLENSWYMGANIPGKVREQLVYLGGLDMYNKQIAAALDGWQGFDVTKAQSLPVR
ncbi:hypothetical protein H2198_003156 [Neophaeococcomyces mojaviensis]|uniref:Uncharacterized protein n=1 Tax=Neophaeococcomyces mojaviensis TaxID=3383035 RepID=A0ACC3AC74_9EURO|nr:hypothetical protein H2198_003156 [Knufia sp. JES_112]